MIRPVALVSLAVACAACASSPSEPEGQVLVARSVPAAPVVDGSLGDPAWGSASWIVVPLEGAAGPHEVRVAAVVHEGTIHFAARWADPTEDRVHKPWTRRDDGTYAAGPEREDVFALGFPISGEFTGIMTSPVECVWDVWHWKAGRTDPAGHAMDKSHVHTFADPGGRRFAMDLPDGRKLHIRRPEDAGSSATKSSKAPTDGTAQATQYTAVVPSGSAADVRARGVWRDGEWTLELVRALDTGHDDDAGLPRSGSTAFAIAVFDRSEDEDHTSSAPLTLRIE